jgi:hypothetical protein
MMNRSLLLTTALLLIGNSSTWAAEDLSLERMATCQDSWLDWEKNEPAQLKTFGDQFRADFSQSENDPFFVPKTDTSIDGLRVLQVFPGSVGMGVGFSAVVDATFENAKRTFSKALGKPLEKCDVSDNMRSCELEIGEKQTFVLMAEDSAKSTTTLLGCYYYYEK